MRPQSKNKGQIIDLTPYCTGNINRPKRRKVGFWPALLALSAFWGAFLAYVYTFTH